MKTLLISALLIASAPAFALNVATSTALGAATRGHVSGPSTTGAAEAARAAGGVCLWQTPGAMEWTNLYAMTKLRVADTTGSNGLKRYATVIELGRWEGVRISIAPGADITVHTASILKRLAECQGRGPTAQ